MYSYYDLKQLNPNEIIMYLRKSRADDPILTVEEILSKHETMLDEWCDKNLGFLVPQNNRYKEIVSGESIADRPKFQTVLKLVESPKIKAILVVELSRLGRPDMEEIGRLSKTFRYTNTVIITPLKAFDITDEYERDMFEQELKRGNFYLEYTKKLLGRGREQSVKSGNYVGSKPPYGYNKIIVMEDKRKCPTLAVNEEQANIVRMIFNWYVNENVGTSNIANKLNEMNIKSPRGLMWTPDSIRTVIENPHYIGKVRFNERKGVHIVVNGEFKKTRPKAAEDEVIFCEGKHDPIISEELFFAAAEKRKKTHRTVNDKQLRNPLASMLFCECGRGMSYRHSTRGNLQYREPRLVCNRQQYCHNASCSITEIVDFTTNLLKEKIAEFELEAKRTDNGKAKMRDALIKNLEKKLMDLDEKELSLWDTRINTPADQRVPDHIFQALTAKIAKEREETKKALDIAKQEIITTLNYEKKIITFKEALEALQDDTVSAEEKNKLLKRCIEKMVYHRDPIERIPGAQHKMTSPPIKLQVTLKI